METLKGKNIIERMNQLMNYGKSTPTVKEGRNWANIEYTIKAPNGKTYGILRDQTKFYIKESKVANPTIKDFEFTDGVINGSKKSYTNYSHALSYLNLMIAEMNQKNPKAKAINLLECDMKRPMEEGSIEDTEVPAEIQEKKEKEVDEKTVLKVPQEQPAAAAPAPAPEASAQPEGDTGLDLGGDDTPDLDLGDDSGDDDLGDEEPLEGGEETKIIQKLTGKLGQKMRDLDEPDPDLTKYVMNSVMSALDLQDLEAKDQKQIVKKMKKKMAGEGEMDDADGDAGLDLGDEGGEDLDMGGDEASSDLDFGSDEEEPKKEKDLAENDAPYGEKKEPQNIKTASAPFNEKPKNIKTESKIQKTIKKYFELTPEEKKEKDNQFLNESINKAMLLKEGKSKCKTVEQEIALGKVLDYDKGFAIKTMKENVIIDTNRKVNLGGNIYTKLIMVETSGKVSGILKDTVKKTARQYRMKDKNDYKNFISLGI